MQNQIYLQINKITQSLELFVENNNYDDCLQLWTVCNCTTLYVVVFGIGQFVPKNRTTLQL